MSKHTPGPWEAHSLMVSEAGQPIGRGRDICHCGIGMRPPSDSGQALANARLIAAAPDLLIELRQAVIQLEMAAECIENKRYDEALLHASSLMRSKRAAIAKASGES